MHHRDEEIPLLFKKKPKIKGKPVTIFRKGYSVFSSWKDSNQMEVIE